MPKRAVPNFALIAQGASVKAVLAQLGHATASITLANRERTQRGPAVVTLTEAAGR